MKYYIFLVFGGFKLNKQIIISGDFYLWFSFEILSLLPILIRQLLFGHTHLQLPNHRENYCLPDRR